MILQEPVLRIRVQLNRIQRQEKPNPDPTVENNPETDPVPTLFHNSPLSFDINVNTIYIQFWIINVLTKF